MHSRLLQAIRAHALQTPEKTAIIALDGEAVSYSRLWRSIRGAAAFLASQGISKGDRVMLSAQKDAEFIYLYFGAHMIGAVNVVVDAKNNSGHIAYIASVTKPRLAFGVEAEECRSMRFSEIDFGDVVGALPSAGCSEDDPADIMFTSGTTGKPKGVVLSHFNVYSSASNINRFIGNSADDIELLGLPICHSFGLGRLRCNMLAGSTVVLHNGFANIKSVFAAFEKHGVTGFGMVPAIWAYIKKFSGARIGKYAGQIRYIEIGSAAMPIEDKAMLAELFPHTRICMHYGLTEASRSVFMEFHQSIADLGAAGKPVVPEVEVKIMDEEGAEVAAGQEGEVCVKGNMVMKSYYLPEDNTGAFFGGYFRTGDWGRMSSEGNLYLVARKKELINVGGKKVSPIEIEEALEKAGVAESMCVAMPDPEGVLGEAPKALLAKGSFSRSIDEIKRDLASMLESHKLPKAYEVVDAIPKTASGKKKRTV
ncbi:MAG: acyl--CoA ligase [Clostridium sp.]|nr:acyl--CoA ligase [Clostridium sp.]